MEKVMPIGYEDLKEIIDKGLYYVDKTFMIKELLDFGGKVNLFTRPRRFGKTLTQSMLRRFFEQEIDGEGNPVDNRYIFQDLQIASCGEQYMSKQGIFPVINLSFKSAKQPDYEMAYASVVDEIAQEYRRHDYVLGTPLLTDMEKRRFTAIRDLIAEKIEYAKSLEFLSYCLAKYHHKNVIILLDEYDVPLENAYLGGFYEKMITFVRSLLESALKTNPNLEFAVITGCLRISKESIFTGLNNLDIYSILNPDFADSFGFTEKEVMDALSYYGIEQKSDEVREWYNGYCFGDKDIYNPWSIINYVKAASRNPKTYPKPYWSNTSSNSIVRELVEKADFETREEIEELLEGKSIEKTLHEDITYSDIWESRENLWNFLFFTGYLKKLGETYDGEKIYSKLAIPNTEIRSIYRNTIMAWFNRKIDNTDLSPIFSALESGDCDTFGRLVSAQLMESISFYDYSENYYHGFLAGLLKSSNIYGVYSNRESGTGRPDLIVKSRALRDGKAFILELKVADSFDQMENACVDALKQIENREYEASLRLEGYRDIRKYGISFFRKECFAIEAKTKLPKGNK
ncbi:ATP-binding protein [Blautia schinkii]|nr:ATP-binding protein [Blautia schinkii]